jgi:hypothetical protein
MKGMSLLMTLPGMIDFPGILILKKAKEQKLMQWKKMDKGRFAYTPMLQAILL